MSEAADAGAAEGYGEGSGSVLRRLGRGAAAALTAAAVTWVLSHSDLYREFDQELRDNEYRMTAPPFAFDDVVVVDIDEASLIALESQLGTWPYSRDVYAYLARDLLARGAEQVVFDVLMSEARWGDDELAALVEAEPRRFVFAAAASPIFVQRSPEADRRAAAFGVPVDGGASAPEWGSVLLPTPGLAARRVGMITIQPGDDGIYRYLTAVHRVNDQFLPALPLAMLGVEDAVRIDGGLLRQGPYRWPVDERGRIALQMPESLESLTVVPLYRQLLDAIETEESGTPPPRTLAGKSVLIGSSATVLGDYAILPHLGRVPGLYVQALSYTALLDGLVLRPQQLALDAALVALALLLSGLGPWVLGGGVRAILFVGVGAIVATYTIHVLLMVEWQLLSVALFPLMAAFVNTGLHLIERINYLSLFRRRLILERNAAEEANQLKSQFLATVTHELRTPLAAIEGYNRLIQEDPALEPDRRDKYHGLVHQSARQLLLLINNLLDQSRLEAGQLQIESRSVCPAEALESVVDLLQPLARDKGLALRLETGEQLPARVMLDDERIRQVVINLVGNALKFTPSGSVTVSADWVQGEMRVAVRDTGPGIPPDSLERIFEAFRQSSASLAEHGSGTGLGLAISRNLVQLMGGRIEVESEDGRGATFSFAVPAPAVAETPAVREPVEDEAPATSGGAHVLLVDDNEELRLLMALYLKQWGYRLSQADSGEAALSAFAAEAPDIVLLDLLLPGISGSEVAAELRSRSFGGRILALSAHVAPDELQAAIDAGCDDTLQKPVDPARLRRALGELKASGG